MKNALTWFRRWGEEGALAMTGKLDKIELTSKPKGRPLPRRPSHERVAENIEKWANSSGLQKPT